MRLKTTRLAYIGLCLIVILVLAITTKKIKFSKHHAIDRIKGFYDTKVSSTLPSFSSQDSLAIFPLVFDEGSTTKLKEFYKKNIGNDIKKNSKIFRFNGKSSALTDMIVHSKYHKHEISVYDSIKDIDGNTDKCHPELNKKLNIEVSTPKEFSSSYSNMAKILNQQLKEDPPFKEMRGFFEEDLQKHREQGKADEHWYKFAGTSVWLEQYGVHFMISRMMYSPPGRKKNSLISLVYAQVYNEKWEELQDVELVIPTANELTGEDEAKSLRLPRFLPIPFYHDSNYRGKRFYGPEDARMLLVKNNKGIEEPLIIFNAYHRKCVSESKIDEWSSNIKYDYYRSMFMGWPFQFQKGKENVDGTSNPDNTEIEYNKVLELRNGNSPRLKMQKNWTPFVSMKDRQADGYDKNLYFIYRWHNLEILKCEISDAFDISRCDFVYKRTKDLPIDEGVGPLRGGTELISLNNILPTTNTYLPQDTEIWIGLSRAHIKKCGCGSSMYRPNLAVITREGNDYKISQLSSFLSLDIPLIGWSDPNNICHPREPNALIPNGISSWNTINYNLGRKQMFEDYAVISLSVADATDHKIYVKNLLHTILGETSILSPNKESGYTDDLVSCSLKYSEKFCAAYGDEVFKVGKSN